MGRKSYTKEYLLDKLKEASVILGRTPGQRDIERLPSFPCRGAYRNHFGTIEKAKKLIGLPPSIAGFNNPIVRIAGYKALKQKYLINGKHPINTFRKHTSYSIRFQVLHRDNFTCQYCGQTPAGGAKLEVDHINPINNNGKTCLDNLITACFKCNHGKHAKILSNHPKKIPQRIANKRISEALKDNQISFIA